MDIVGDVAAAAAACGLCAAGTKAGALVDTLVIDVTAGGRATLLAGVTTAATGAGVAGAGDGAGTVFETSGGVAATVGLAAGVRLGAGVEAVAAVAAAADVGPFSPFGGGVDLDKRGGGGVRYMVSGGNVSSFNTLDPQKNMVS